MFKEDKISNLGIFIIYMSAITFSLIGIFLIVNFPISVQSSTPSVPSAQNNEQTPWYEIVGIATIISTLISSGLSAIFNYRITVVQLNKNHTNTLGQLQQTHNNDLLQLQQTHNNALTQLEKVYTNTINEMKKDKLMQELKDQRILYASLISRLSKAKSLNEEQLGPTLKEIDGLIKDKYYLFSSVVMDKWLKTLVDYSDPTELDDLTKELIKEYNNDIILQYRDIIGIELKTIPS
jgi:hypothetical protein